MPKEKCVTAGYINRWLYGASKTGLTTNIDASGGGSAPPIGATTIPYNQVVTVEDLKNGNVYFQAPGGGNKYMGNGLTSNNYKYTITTNRTTAKQLVNEGSLTMSKVVTSKVLYVGAKINSSHKGEFEFTNINGKAISPVPSTLKADGAVINAAVYIINKQNPQIYRYLDYEQPINTTFSLNSNENYVACADIESYYTDDGYELIVRNSEKITNPITGFKEVFNPIGNPQSFNMKISGELAFPADMTRELPLPSCDIQVYVASNKVTYTVTLQGVAPWLQVGDTGVYYMDDDSNLQNETTINIQPKILQVKNPSGVVVTDDSTLKQIRNQVYSNPITIDYGLYSVDLNVENSYVFTYRYYMQ